MRHCMRYGRMMRRREINPVSFSFVCYALAQMSVGLFILFANLAMNLKIVLLGLSVLYGTETWTMTQTDREAFIYLFICLTYHKYTKKRTSINSRLKWHERPTKGKFMPFTCDQQKRIVSKKQTRKTKHSNLRDKHRHKKTK